MYVILKSIYVLGIEFDKFYCLEIKIGFICKFKVYFFIRFIIFWIEVWILLIIFIFIEGLEL